MLDEKRIKIIEKTIPLLLEEGEIVKDEKQKSFITFYCENARISLITAKILQQISEKKELKMHFPEADTNFEAYLWVINSAYYSMFYNAGALLAMEAIKIKSDVGIHKKTYEALVYYFFITKKLAKQYLESFEEMQVQSQQLLRTEEIMKDIQDKVKGLLDNYDSEMEKRTTFTYNIGEKAKAAKSATSIKRAMEFYNESLRLLNSQKTYKH